MKAMPSLKRSSPEISKIKEIIQNLATVTFQPPQEDKTSNEINKGTVTDNLEVVKEKLVVVGTNPLVSYIISKLHHTSFFIYDS